MHVLCGAGAAVRAPVRCARCEGGPAGGQRAGGGGAPQCDVCEAVQVLLDAALRHARAGEPLAYAVYAAAKLSRPEYVRPLCAAMQPSIKDMNAQDVNHVVWAAATCRITDGVDFAGLLERLRLLLESAAHDGGGAGGARDGLSASRHGGSVWEPEQPPVRLAGWQLAQMAWSLAHLKVEGADDMLRLLIAAVRYAAASLRRARSA